MEPVSRLTKQERHCHQLPVNKQCECIQETEIPKNYSEDELNFVNFNLELEQNNEKKRAGIYIRKDIKYVSRKDLEEENFHGSIVDVLTSIIV